MHCREIRFVREKRFADFAMTIYSDNYYAPLHYYILSCTKGAAGSRFRTTATRSRGPREKADGEERRQERATAARRRWKWRPVKHPPIGRHCSVPRARPVPPATPFLAARSSARERRASSSSPVLRASARPHSHSHSRAPALHSHPIIYIIILAVVAATAAGGRTLRNLMNLTLD